MRLVMGITAAMLAASNPAIAQIQSQAQPQPTAKTSFKPDQVICEKQEETGSRLSAQKVCHTREQWDELRGSDRSAIEHVQSQRSLSNDGH